MQDNLSNVFIVLSGFVSVLIGYLFDVPPAVLWAAAIGSAGGVAISSTVGKWQGFCLIAGGTIVTGHAVALLIKKLPDYSLKSLAFFIALLLIAFRDPIRLGMGQLINVAFSAIGNWITRLGGKAGGDQP